VSPEHHELIFEFRIGSRNFGDSVVGLVIVIVKLRFHVHLNLDRDLLGHQARQASEMLHRERDFWIAYGLAFLVAAARLHEDGAVLAR
jgi:hypothetical protein